MKGKNIYLESRKMVLMKLFAEQKQRHRCREQIYGYQGGEKMGGTGRLGSTHIHHCYYV